MKRKFKKYSVDDKVKYHSNVLKSDFISDDKKCRSNNWLDGYNDEHALSNLSAVKSELKHYQEYTMIDESTRERFIYPYEDLCGNSTVDFVQRAITYFRYSPQMIQTDNGSEFTYTRQTKNDKKHLLDIYCEQNNIVHKLIKPRTPRHNGKVERSHRSDNERFYRYLKFYDYDDLLKQMHAYLKRSNNIPISTLKSSAGKKNWLTPKQKRAELLLLDWGLIE